MSQNLSLLPPIIEIDTGQEVTLEGVRDNGIFYTTEYGLRKRIVERFATNDMSPEDLRVLLHNQIAIAKPIWSREQNTFGRLLNRLTQSYPGYGQVNGTILMGLLKATNSHRVSAVREIYHYAIRLDLLETLLDDIQTAINEQEFAAP